MASDGPLSSRCMLGPYNRLRDEFFGVVVKKRRPAGRGTKPGPVSERAGQRTRGRSRSSWDPVASWYDSTVGVRGSPHHRKAAVPAVMRLAEIERGELVVDVGCGQGVMAHHVAKSGGRYLGVDASAAMIRFARERRQGEGQFEVGDARDLVGTTSLEAGSAAVAMFVLSIQDMDPLQDVIASTARVLAPGGRVVMFMIHPAFRAPRGSGWGYDEGRKLVYRRVERYLTPAAVPMKAYSEVSRAPRGATISFHRPLQTYVTALSANGLWVDALEEMADPVAHADKAGSPEIPLFLALRARLQPQRH